MLTPVNMESFVMSPEDVTELLPDVTQQELEDIAGITSEYLMNYWQECLDAAVVIVKGDRRANIPTKN